MKYRDFFLNESWKDYVVSTNPETLLYDFYVLSYLTTLPLEAGEKGFAGTFIGRDPKEIRLDIKEAESKLLPALRDKLSEALFIAICAEVRHVLDQPQSWDKYKGNKLLTQYIRNFKLQGVPATFLPTRNIDRPGLKPKDINYVKSFNAATKAIKDTGSTREQFANLAADLFRNMSWSAAYGGEKWAQIAEAYNLLNKSPQTFAQLQVAIDHAYDLQHNTGTVLNKVKEYYINGDITWLQKALDFKANLKSVYQLLPKCSSDMRKLALEAFKTAGVKKDTLEKTTARAGIVDSDEETTDLSKKPSSIVDALGKKCKIVNPDGTLSKLVKVIGIYGTGKVVVAIPEKDQIKTRNFYIDELVWSDWDPVNKTKTSDEFKVGEKYIYEFENNKYEVELVRKTSLMVGPHEQVIVKILNYILINNEDKLKIGSKMSTNTSYLKKLKFKVNYYNLIDKYKVGDVIAFPGYVYEIYKLFPDYIHLKVVKTEDPKIPLYSVVEYSKREFERRVAGKYQFLSIDDFKVGDKFKNLDTGEVGIVQSTTNRNIVIYTVVDVDNKDPLYKQTNIKELVGNIKFLSKTSSEELPKADFSMGLEPEGDSDKNVGKFVEFNDSPILGGTKKLIFKGQIIGYDRSEKKFSVKILSVTPANSEHGYDYSVGDVVRWNDDGSLKISKNRPTSSTEKTKGFSKLENLISSNFDYSISFKLKKVGIYNKLKEIFKGHSIGVSDVAVDATAENIAEIIKYDLIDQIVSSINESESSGMKQRSDIERIFNKIKKMANNDKKSIAIKQLSDLVASNEKLKKYIGSSEFFDKISDVVQIFNEEYYRDFQSLFNLVTPHPIEYAPLSDENLIMIFMHIEH